MNMKTTNNLKKIQEKMPLIIVRIYCSSGGLKNHHGARSGVKNHMREQIIK